MGSSHILQTTELSTSLNSMLSLQDDITKETDTIKLHRT